jgi:hypothetical protein
MTPVYAYDKTATQGWGCNLHSEEIQDMYLNDGKDMPAAPTSGGYGRGRTESDAFNNTSQANPAQRAGVRQSFADSYYSNNDQQYNSDDDGRRYSDEYYSSGDSLDGAPDRHGNAGGGNFNPNYQAQAQNNNGRNNAYNGSQADRNMSGGNNRKNQKQKSYGY